MVHRTMDDSPGQYFLVKHIGIVRELSTPSTPCPGNGMAGVSVNVRSSGMWCLRMLRLRMWCLRMWCLIIIFTNNDGTVLLSYYMVTDTIILEDHILKHHIPELPKTPLLALVYARSRARVTQSGCQSRLLLQEVPSRVERCEAGACFTYTRLTTATPKLQRRPSPSFLACSLGRTMRGPLAIRTIARPEKTSAPQTLLADSRGLRKQRRLADERVGLTTRQRWCPVATKRVFSCVHIYIYIYMYVCMCVYIYIYT